MDIECPNNAFNAVKTLYKGVFKSAIPLKSIKQNRKYITREPWVTSGLLVSSRTKTKTSWKSIRSQVYITSNYTRLTLKDSRNRLL